MREVPNRYPVIGRRPLSRRALVTGAGAAGLAAALGTGALGARGATLVQTPTATNISGTELSILQWRHFIPAWDEWFDVFLAEWAEANGVRARVDRVDAADLPAAFAAEIAAGQGHDIVEHIFPMPQHEAAVLDLTDLVVEARNRHGNQAEFCARSSRNPTTGTYHGFVHGYAPSPGNYRRGLWANAGLANGPTTYDELLAGGSQIQEQLGAQVGIGLSRDADSQLAAQTIIWAFGGAIQDEDENITINSPETIAAVTYVKELYETCMSPDVLAWNTASNNQYLVEGRASYILNSISAYRAAQEQQPEAASDLFFSRPLAGPAGPERAFTHGNPLYTAMIPAHAANVAAAQEFLLHLVANYEASSLASQLYTFPAFPETFPTLIEDGGPLDNDPNGSDPPDKLAPLKLASEWTVQPGWPGPANAMVGECFDTFILSDMMARVARGDQTPEEAVAEAEAKLIASANAWREQGLMGGA